MLRGAERLLARCRPVIVMEVVGPHLDDETRNPLRLLERHGYSFQDVMSGMPITIEEMRQRLPRNDIELTTSMNVVAEVRP